MLAAPGDIFAELTRAHRYRWTHVEELLALILTKLDELVIITATVYGDPKRAPSRPPKPYQYPRPEPPKPRRRTSIEEISAFFRRR